MTKKLYLFIFLLAVVLFVGCHQQTDTTSKGNTDINEKSLYYDLYPSGTMQVYSSDIGTYYMSTVNGAIGYFDEETQSKTVLCNRLECAHADNTCPAYIGALSYGLFMNEDKSKLFVNYVGNERSDSGENINYIDVMDYDGLNRKTIYEFVGNSIERNFAFDDDKMYFITTSAQTLGQNETIDIGLKYELMELNYITGESKTVKKLETLYSIVSAYGENIILEKSPTSFTADDGSLYSYNLSDESVTLLIKNIGGYGTGAFVNQENLYVFQRISERKAQLTQKNLRNGEEKVISENVTYFGSHSGNVNPAMFFDDYLVITSVLPPQTDTMVLDDETYAIHLTDGQERLINLQNEFNDYAFMYDMKKHVVLNTGWKNTNVEITDVTDGSKKYIEAFIPFHAIFSKEDYLNGVDSGIMLEE